MRILILLFLLPAYNIRADDKGFSLQGIVLERSDFNHVFKVLKVPKVELLNDRDRKEEHNTGKFICFITRDNIILEFWSSNTMAQGKYITEINFYTPGHSNIRFDQKKCSDISLQSSNLKFKNEIGPNTKKKAVYDHLGNPMKEVNGRFFTPNTLNKPELGFVFFRSRIFPGMDAYSFYKVVNDSLDETLTVRVGYNKKNFVNMISASKVTTAR